MKNKNVLIIFIYSFLNSFLLYRACDVLYYISKGISNNEYINYLTIASFITIIFLIPFGIIKDKYNRKNILIISNIFLLFATLFYIYSNNVYLMGIGIIMSAVSNLLSQGIAISLLHSYTDNKTYSKMYYKWSIFYYSGYLISMILGGIVAKYSLVMMYYISIIPIILNFVVLFIFDYTNEKNKKKSKTNYLIKESLKLLKDNKLLKIILFAELIIVPLADIVAESHPEYLANIGASTTLIGIYTAIMCLFAIIGNKLASIAKKQMCPFFIFSILFNISIILIGLLTNYYAILFIILFQCFYSVTNNIHNTTIQNECHDSYRQTILAIFTFIISVSEMIICTITSFIFEIIGLASAYISLGIFGAIVILLILGYYVIVSKNCKVLKNKS